MRTPILFLAALLAAARPLAGQLKSAPVYGVTSARSGWAAAADYAGGLDSASGRARHIGGRVTGVVGPLRLTAHAGVWDAGATTTAQWGGTMLVRLVGIGSTGVAFHALAGAGYARAGPSGGSTTYVTLPVGIAVTKSDLELSGRALTPWLAPRLEADRVSFSGARTSQKGVGVSGGVAAALGRRLGVHVALDVLRVFERSVTGLTVLGGTRVTGGIGVFVMLAEVP